MGGSGSFQGERGLAVSAEAELDLGAWTVTEDRVRQYLAAVGDQQPAYFDLALAPPLALSAWSLGSLLQQLSLPPGAIHSLQDVETIRGVRFGEEIHSTAQVNKPRQRGNMKFISVAYGLTDSNEQPVQSGKSAILVVDSVETGVKSPQPPFTKGGEAQDTPSGSLPEVSRKISQERLNAYADASGDGNPLHLDAAFAADTPFGGIIAHGMLTLAFIGEMMTAELGPSWLETGTIKARFKGAAYLGDDVVTWGRASENGSDTESLPLEYLVGVWNPASGKELITGSATVRI